MNGRISNPGQFSHGQVVTDLEGNFLVQVGSTGAEGLHDGNFDDATFNRPQVTLLIFQFFPFAKLI